MKFQFPLPRRSLSRGAKWRRECELSQSIAGWAYPLFISIDCQKVSALGRKIEHTFHSLDPDSAPDIPRHANVRNHL